MTGNKEPIETVHYGTMIASIFRDGNTLHIQVRCTESDAKRNPRSPDSFSEAEHQQALTAAHIAEAIAREYEPED